MVFLFTLLSFCFINNNKNTNTIYGIGNSFEYVVIVEQSDTIVATDTLRFEIINPTIFSKLLNNNLALWTSRKFPHLSQKRGLNINNQNIEIQMPTIFPYLDYELICVAPYPEYSHTLKLGYTADISHQFHKGYGKLTGLTISQELKALDTLQTSINGQSFTLKKTIGYNTSHQDVLGKYYGTYLFNEKLGFTQMLYKYPNKTIRFDLLSPKIFTE
jgi:hypothetical protein